jgi:cellulose synthase/poly-beta-1,6-N-acetylglucosamine synthase-like glycosyltransferase
MTMVVYIFWFFIGLVFYCWVGYPLILKLLSLFYPKNIKKEDYLPSVTVLLAVFNEEEAIRRKLENLLALEYPKEKLDILVASDGSTDKTNEIVREFADRGVRLFISEHRKGKSATQNEAVKLVNSDILAFTDADTVLDSKFLTKIIQPFADPAVGCVTGLFLLRREGSGTISESQGFYWKYETAMRAIESRIGILPTASGGGMVIRRELFKPLDSQYGEDCVVPLDVILQGYRVMHEPEALAYDASPSSIKGELKTRIRMTLRNWTGTLSRKQLLNPFKYPLVSLSLTSHKLLRWLTSFFLLFILILNLFLLRHPLYQLLFIFQIVFYGLAVIGFILERRSRHLRIFTVPFSFCLANLGMFIGVIKSFLGIKITTYEADK